METNTSAEHGASRENQETVEPLAIEAAKAMEQLKTVNGNHLELVHQFGSIIFRAKATVPHGKFRAWLEQHLNIGRTWVSVHLRLYNRWDDLLKARAWAADNSHPLAHNVSPDKLLILLKAWDARVKFADAEPKPTKTKKKTQHVEAVAETAGGTMPDRQHFIAVFDRIIDALQERDVVFVEALAREARSMLIGKGGELSFRDACHLQMSSPLDIQGAATRFSLDSLMPANPPRAAPSPPQ